MGSNAYFNRDIYIGDNLVLNTYVDTKLFKFTPY